MKLKPIKPEDMDNDLKWIILRTEIEVEKDKNPSMILDWVLGVMESLEDYSKS
jgi:hypothetical protein